MQKFFKKFRCFFWKILDTKIAFWDYLTFNSAQILSEKESGESRVSSVTLQCSNRKDTARHCSVLLVFCELPFFAVCIEMFYTIGWNYIWNHTIFLILYDFKNIPFLVNFSETFVLQIYRYVDALPLDFTYYWSFCIIGQVPKKVVPYVQFILYLKRPDWRWISKFSSNFKCLFTFFLFCWGKSNKN